MEQLQERTYMGFGEQDGSFTVGEKNPWHKLGKHFETAPSIEEGIKAAGLDYNIELKDLQTVDGINVPQKAVVRTDINKSLGIVSKSYNILQNKEAFNFFEPFIENGLATLESAGSLYNGRKVFVLAKIAGDDMEIMPGDMVQKFILLSNSHDGGSAIRVGFTGIRVVCSNTLTMAHSGKNSQLIRVYHTKGVQQTIEEIRMTMDLVNQQFTTTEERYKELAKKSMSVADFKKYIKAVTSKESLEKLLRETPTIEDDSQVKQFTEEEVEEGRNRLIKRVEEVFELEPVHNRWTAYNAVNYYINHERSRNVESRYNSLWFGDAKKLDQRALELAERI